MKKALTFVAGLLLAYAFVAPASASCVCTKIYKPVCARKGKTAKTYGNACAAKCAKARICAQGKCRCPVFRLAAPKPGCRYVYKWKGCCKYPKLVCKRKPKRKAFCTKLNCKKCNKRCQSRKKACIAEARKFNKSDVARVRKNCRNATYRSRHRCLCAWAFRKAAVHIILRGMRSCLVAKCKKRKCCKAGRKLCIPHPPSVRCIKAPCCRKLVCSPKRCK